MSFAKIYTLGCSAYTPLQLKLKFILAQGLPSLTIVGLPEAAVRESKDRVRSAIINSGFQFPNQTSHHQPCACRLAQR